jgi:hypothetical protein
MTRGLLITVVAIAVACGGRSRESDTRDGATAPDGREATSPRGSAGGEPSPAAPNASAVAAQTVTLVGCLVGPNEPPRATGTSGARARARASGSPAAPLALESSRDRFMLLDAVPDGADVAGVGANGAVGSADRLASGTSTFELDGLPADAMHNVNKRVRIVGRLDAPPAPSADSHRVGAGSGGASSSGDAAAARGGTASPANAIGAGAGHGNMGAGANASGRDFRANRLVVESVQLIGGTCTRP